METVFIAEILKAIGEGNLAKGVFLIAVFVIIWLEVRSLKKQLKGLTETISNSFAKGEERFKTIENDVHQIRLELDNIRKTPNLGGFKHGEQSL